MKIEQGMKGEPLLKIYPMRESAERNERHRARRPKIQSGEKDEGEKKRERKE